MTDGALRLVLTGVHQLLKANWLARRPRTFGAYRPPRWSWEIERVIEVTLDDLPRDLSRPAERWIAAVRDKL